MNNEKNRDIRDRGQAGDGRGTLDLCPASVLSQGCHSTVPNSYEDLVNISGPLDLSPYQAPPITRLKDLHIGTEIVSQGRAQSAIVIPEKGIYDEFALEIVDEIRRTTGVTVKLVRDSEATLPFDQNLIIIGNRSTNKVIEQLYNFYYTYLDLKYPGKGGYDIRSLHNPFGNGFNALLIGSSDRDGMAKATRKFTELIRANAMANEITLGWVMKVKLGEGMTPPADAKNLKAWEDFKIGPKGLFFGWNTMSWNMALYYMTGEERFARGFMRLCFPDEKTMEYIWEVEGGGIEEKKHPLSNCYHYEAHISILLWDLIEESPVFTEEERLRITNEFSDQLKHWQSEWCYTGKRYNDPNVVVGARHDEYAALSLYCLAHYFCTYYPHIVWQRNLEAAEQFFDSLGHSINVTGEMDHLPWFATGIEPIMSYMLISGDRIPLQSGALHTLLSSYDALVTGERDDEYLQSQSLSFAHKAAYLAKDNRFIYYRNLTSLDTNTFRIGQSFYPEDDTERMPVELSNRITVAPASFELWSVHTMPMYPHYLPVPIPVPYERSHQFLSYRTGPTGNDDYLMIDGFLAGVRNPYHCLAIYQLRIKDKTLLLGLENQLIVRQGGITEPSIPIASAVKERVASGNVAHLELEVPNFSHGSWVRRILHVPRRWTLVIDEIMPRDDYRDLDLIVRWQVPSMPRIAEEGWIEYQVGDANAAIIPWVHSDLHVDQKIVECSTRYNAKKDSAIRIATLVGTQPTDGILMCSKLTDSTAFVESPGPTLVAIGTSQMLEATVVIEADVTVVDQDFVYTNNATRIVFGAPLLESNKPLTISWSMTDDEIKVFCPEQAALGLSVSSGGALRVDGKTADVTHTAGGLVWIRLDRGDHIIRGARARESNPFLSILGQLRTKITRPLMKVDMDQRFSALPQLKSVFSRQIDEPLKRIIAGPDGDGESQAIIISRKSAYMLSPDGGTSKIAELEADIMSAAYWPEASLLLLGGSDDLVYAFDPSGLLNWSYLSVTAPELGGTMPAIWLKKGLPGISGLATGRLIGEETQAFVGSACTVEIVNASGQLIRRLPSFLGSSYAMEVLAMPDGSRRLLISKWPNSVNSIGVVDIRDWSITQDFTGKHNFTGLPTGHVKVPEWHNMQTSHIIVTDINGDGKQEVVLDINGAWNRVCAYDCIGEPLWSVSFGPGLTFPDHLIKGFWPKSHMIGLHVADIDGDGLKESVVATAEGTVNVIGEDGRRKWYVQPGRLRSMGVMPTPQGFLVLAGREDGLVVAFDPLGKPIARAEFGQPVVAIHPFGKASSKVAIGTADSRITVLNL
mgnify:CR=1 FL=1